MTTTAAALHDRPVRRIVVAAIDAVAFGIMIVAAGLALGPSYGGARWIVAVAIGAVIGVVAGSLPVVARWPAAATVAIGVVGYFLIGPAVATPASAVAGVLPGPESVRLLAIGIVNGWKQVLTVADPVGSAGALLVPAFLIGLVPAAVSTSLAGRLRQPLWSLGGPAAVLVAAAALGTLHSHFPAVAGVVVVVSALGWGAWRIGGFGPAGIDVRRPVSVAVLLAGAVAAAVFVAPLVAPASARSALREAVQPQFDPQTYQSPLSAFRRYVTTDATTKMITVTGLPKGGRIRVATMDSYNGLYYTVSTRAGAFTGVGDVVRSTAAGTSVTLQIRVDDYAGVWLPDIGSMTGIEFTGPRATDLTGSLRYSAATGTAVVTADLESGDQYQISAIVPDVPDKQALEKLGVGPAPLSATTHVPAALVSAAATLTDGKQTVYDKVEAIRSALSSRGLLSHGDTLPSPSGHGYDRLLRLMNDRRMVGDQEQFAPAMALMVQSLGIPARVVLGMAPKNYDGSGTVTLTGSDMTAWVEVDFDQVGWVPFDPTPDESRVQQQAAPQPKAAPRRQVLQPPPPPRVPEDADATDVQNAHSDNHKKKGDDDKPGAATGVSWVLAAGVGVPVLVIVLPMLLILLLKLRQRRRRRAGAPARRVAGGWDHLLGGAVDLGAVVPRKLTRTETAAVIDGHFGADTMVLARAADQRVFGPGEPDPGAADEYWNEIDRALAGLRKTVSPWRRLRSALSTLSLRRGAS